MNTATPPNPAGSPPPELPKLKVTDLSDIFALHREPIGAKIYCYGKELEFSGRRLLPNEVAEIRNLLKQAIPPRTGEKGEYDFDDAAYRANAENCRQQARAKALWLSFHEVFAPAAERAKAPTADLGQITAFIQSLPMADDVLETLYGVALNEPVSLIELTGFTSGSSSPKS